MTRLVDRLAAMPTGDYLAIVRWMAANPGEQGPGAVFACIDERGRAAHGRALQARRAHALRMRGRLESAGWIDRDERLTDAGLAVALNGDRFPDAGCPRGLDRGDRHGDSIPRPGTDVGRARGNGWR